MYSKPNVKQTKRYILCTLALVMAILLFMVDSHYIVTGVKSEAMQIPENIELSIGKKKFIGFHIGDQIYVSRCRDTNFCVKENIGKVFVGKNIVFIRTHIKKAGGKDFNYGLIVSGEVSDNQQKTFVLKVSDHNIKSIEKRDKIALLFARLFILFCVLVGSYGLIGLFRERPKIDISNR